MKHSERQRLNQRTEARFNLFTAAFVTLLFFVIVIWVADVGSKIGESIYQAFH